MNAGDTFDDWNTAPDGSGTSYAPVSTLSMPAGNLTLYAIWTPDSYGVTYNGNGATAGTVPVDANSYGAGATVSVSGNTGNLVNTGSTFVLDWNTAANGSGTSYAPVSTLSMPAGNLTLYAIWTPNILSEHTTTGFSLSKTSVAYGADTSETFTVTVTGQPGDGYPEGTVSVYSSSDQTVQSCPRSGRAPMARRRRARCRHAARGGLVQRRVRHIHTELRLVIEFRIHLHIFHVHTSRGSLGHQGHDDHQGLRVTDHRPRMAMNLQRSSPLPSRPRNGETVSNGNPATVNIGSAICTVLLTAGKGTCMIAKSALPVGFVLGICSLLEAHELEWFQWHQRHQTDGEALTFSARGGLSSLTTAGSGLLPRNLLRRLPSPSAGLVAHFADSAARSGQGTPAARTRLSNKGAFDLGPDTIGSPHLPTRWARPGPASQRRSKRTHMSGHSKWATTKYRKGAQDKARAKVFAKCIRLVEVAARDGGGDLEANATLRTAYQKAAKQFVPLLSIEKAIKRGTGDLEGVRYESINYEGYGPGGVAIIVETLSDSRNRTGAEMRNLFSRNGGNMAEPGSVSWQFERKGIVTVALSNDEDKVMEIAMEGGAEDLSSNGAAWVVTSAPGDLESVRQALDDAGITPESVDLSLDPTTLVPVPEESEAKKVLRLLEAIDDHDDVQSVHSNANISDESWPPSKAEFRLWGPPLRRSPATILRTHVRLEHRPRVVPLRLRPGHPGRGFVASGPRRRCARDRPGRRAGPASLDSPHRAEQPHRRAPARGRGSRTGLLPGQREDRHVGGPGQWTRPGGRHGCRLVARYTHGEQVQQAVGYGAATKDQVQRMVARCSACPPSTATTWPMPWPWPSAI